MEYEKYISIVRLAAALGVPQMWMSAEARAGRIPYLRAGRRMLFSATAVRAALEKRVSRGVGDGKSILPNAEGLLTREAVAERTKNRK